MPDCYSGFKESALTDPVIWIAEGDPRHGAVLLLTDTAPPPGPWFRAFLVLLFLTFAGQALAAQTDDALRGRGNGGKPSRPPAERVVGARPTSLRDANAALGVAQ